MIDVDFITWDFDGVINANVVDGHFTWIDTFQEDLGHSPELFLEHMFNDSFREVLRGERDIMDQLRNWASHVQLSGSLREIYDYWLKKDSMVDERVLDVMAEVKARGVGNAIGTNNDPKRANYIERDMGLGAHIDHMFAAGRMGVLKPDAAFFEHISEVLGIAPDRLILIDDFPENIEGADAAGWHTHHYTSFDVPTLRARLGLG